MTSSEEEQMPGSSEYLAHSTQQGIRSDFDTDPRDKGITSSESHDAECAELERLLTSPSTARVCRSEGGLSEEVDKLETDLESLNEELKITEHKIEERTDTLRTACQTDVSELSFQLQDLQSRVRSLKLQNKLKKQEICETKLRVDAERVKRVSDILKTLCLKKGRGVDPILKASILGNPLIVELLIWFGSDVNATDASSYTPLHWATRQGHLEVVKVLLDKGAEVDTRCASKQTALHLASKFREVSIASTLCAYGATRDLCDENGKTPVQLFFENSKSQSGMIDKKEEEAEGYSKTIHLMNALNSIASSLYFCFFKM